MANYFPIGNISPMVPHTRINSQNVNNVEQPDFASLSMSLANTYLNSSYRNAVSTHRMGGVRFPRPFSSGQPYQQSQNFDLNNWVARHDPLSPVSGPPIVMDSNLSDHFASNRYMPSRSSDEPKSIRVNKRLPLVNEGVNFNEIQVSRPSKLSLSGPCDVTNSFGPMVPAAPPSPSQLQDSYRWAMYPPVPAYGLEHLKTGRFHLMENTSKSDGNSITYMKQALYHSLKSKMRMCLPSTTVNTKIPQQIGPYTSVSAMEDAPALSQSLGLLTQCFKAWCPRLCTLVVLRRVVLEPSKILTRDSYVLASELSEAKDSSVLRLQDVVPIQEFGDNSLLFTYEFLPCACSLGDMFMMDHSRPPDRVIYTDMLQERTAWMLLVQLTQVIRFAHKTLHRSINILDPSKILIQDGTRLFVNCFGLKDVVNHPATGGQIAEGMVKDLVTLGRLMVGAIVGTRLAFEKPTEYLFLLDSVVGHGLRDLIQSLLSGSMNNVDDLVLATADHVYDNLDAVESLGRHLERHALSEVSNGRLFRLICKLNSVIERQDIRTSKRHEPEWSETDDRYMLKLFRDYVFHQVDHNGAPYLDLAHIVTSLNKVEAASGEHLCLVSRKGEKAIIVTYAEIRDWLDKSFSHLVEDCRRSMFEQQMAQSWQRDQQKQQGDTVTSEVS